jgi:hypothetical protein
MHYCDDDDLADAYRPLRFLTEPHASTIKTSEIIVVQNETISMTNGIYFQF